MMSHAEAVVCGHICLDIIPGLEGDTANSLSETIQPGQLVNVGEAMVSTGGVVSNTGLALHKLGIQTELIAKVGNDMLGEATKSLIRSQGEQLDQLIVGEQASSYSVVLSAPGQDRTFLHFNGANDSFKAHDIDYDQLEGVRLFHFGYPPTMKSMYEDQGAELVEMFRQLKHHLITTSLDMTMPDLNSEAGQLDWKTLLEHVLPYVDIFLPSLEEIMLMMRRDDYLAHVKANPDQPIEISLEGLRELADEMIEMGVAISGIKLGDRGLYLKTTENLFELQKFGKAAPSHYLEWLGYEIYAPCYEIEITGSNGAGDSAYAGFLAAVLKDKTLEEAVAAATAVGGSACEATDAVSGVKDWEQTMSRVGSGWSRLQPSIDIEGMEFHEDTGVWLNISE